MTALSFAFVLEVLLVHFVPFDEVMIVPFPPTETKRGREPSAIAAGASLASESTVSSEPDDNSSYFDPRSSLRVLI